MKIANKYVNTGKLLKRWEEAAEQTMLDYGIWIKVRTDYATDPHDGQSYTSRIYFVVDEREFESLNDLKKALDNKAFL